MFAYGFPRKRKSYTPDYGASGVAIVNCRLQLLLSLGSFVCHPDFYVEVWSGGGRSSGLRIEAGLLILMSLAVIKQTFYSCRLVT
jgi:hypothetical protein